MPKKKKKEEKRKATHELTDLDVFKIDLVDRPATGDLWLVSRSADSEPEQLEEEMPRTQRSAIAPDDYQEIYDVGETASDDSQTEAETPEPASEPEVEREEETAAVSPEQTQEVSEVGEVVSGVVESIDVRKMIREEIKAALSDLKQIETSQPESESTEETESETEEQERAGAKMKKSRFARMSGAVNMIEGATKTLRDITNEIGGAKKKTKREEEPSEETVEAASQDLDLDELVDGITRSVVGQLTEKFDEAMNGVAEEVKTVVDRVKEIESHLTKPKARPKEQTDTVVREEKPGLWNGKILGRRR